MKRLWLEIGIRAGWVSPPFCDTYDGGYQCLKPEIQDEFDEGGDPCVTALLLL